MFPDFLLQAPWGAEIEVNTSGSSVQKIFNNSGFHLVSRVDHGGSRACARHQHRRLTQNASQDQAAGKRRTFFLPRPIILVGGTNVTSTYFLALAIRSRPQFRSSLCLMFS